jgi:hypothetical protein
MPKDGLTPELMDLPSMNPSDGANDHEPESQQEK